MVEVEFVQFYQFVETPDPDAPIKTSRHEVGEVARLVALDQLQRRHGPRMALERMHELLCALPVVPLVDANVSIICSDDEVVHFIVDEQVSYEIFPCRDLTHVELHRAFRVLYCRSSKLEIVETQVLFVPRNKEALLQVQGHALHPLSYLLELVEAVMRVAPTFCRDHLYFRGITLRVESDCLSWWVCILDVELNYEAALNASGYQLHRLVQEHALLDESYIEWNVWADLVKVLIQYDQLEIPRECKVEVILLRIADARYLPVHQVFL